MELHTTTFRLPGQLAALVNLGVGGRVLRIYRAEGDEMVEVAYWVAEQ